MNHRTAPTAILKTMGWMPVAWLVTCLDAVADMAASIFARPAPAAHLLRHMRIGTSRAKKDLLTQSSAELFDQRHGGGRRAQFPFVDEKDEDVAWLASGFVRGIDGREILGRFALGPDFRARGPDVEVLRFVGGRQPIIAALEPRIDDLAGYVGD